MNILITIIIISFFYFYFYFFNSTIGVGVGVGAQLCPQPPVSSGHVLVNDASYRACDVPGGAVLIIRNCRPLQLVLVCSNEDIQGE